jgi:hypothetical protein
MEMERKTEGKKGVLGEGEGEEARIRVVCRRRITLIEALAAPIGKHNKMDN